MPELPDVEGFRRIMADHAVGTRIADVVTLDTGVLHGVSVRRLRATLRGERFEPPRRVGKWLIAPVTGGAVVVLHFGMTGSLDWGDGPDGRQRHDRVVFVVGDGELRYRDQRKLQGLWLLRAGAQLERLLDGTGPDALEVPRSRFTELLAARRQVKPLLADQSVVAGLGNLLVDEILWRGKVNPRAPAASVDADALHRQMRRVLRSAVRAGRVPPRPSWLTGRRDEPSGSCARCGTTLSHGRVGGRGTVWCPHCQPG